MANRLTLSLFSLLLALMLIATIFSLPSSLLIKKDVTNLEAEASGPNDFRFAAVGDWGCTSATAAMTSMMSTRNPEVVVGLGDYSYSTTMKCWHDILSNYPIVHNALHLHDSTVLGNHELPTCGSNQCLNATGNAEYLAHFNQPPTFYSFDHKRVHFVVLDTNISPATQSSFLSSDLSQAKQQKDNGFIDWIVVAMHHPFYTSCIGSPCDIQSHGNMTAFRTSFQTLFDQNDVDVVLQAHIHAYERMAPLKSGAEITHPDTFDYTNPIGQIYLTVGTGGKDHYHYTSHPVMSLKQIEDIDGFLQVDVTESTFVGRFVDTAGFDRDIFIITRSPDALPGPPGPPPPPSGKYFHDNWATSLNTADYLNNYQLKLGEKITDTARRNLLVLNTTMYLQKPTTGSPTGTITAQLINANTGSVIATSMTSLTRTSITPVYLPYTFTFPTTSLTPTNSDFIIVISCNNCNAEKTYLAAVKTNNPYTLGSETVFRSGSWQAREPDARGSVWYSQ